MKAYISVSYTKRKELTNEIISLKKVLSQNKIDSIVFVDEYAFSAIEETEMMETAMKEIDHCDFLIAETSDKGIGICIEAGYAKAKNKPIIYMRKIAAEHSTTLAGLSDFKIIYTDTRDLEYKVLNVIEILQNRSLNLR